jgi:hypothetical protein
MRRKIESSSALRTDHCDSKNFLNLQEASAQL